MVNSSTWTHGVGDDALSVGAVSTAGSVDSNREWCFLDTINQRLYICGISDPASDLAFWNMKVSWVLPALASLFFSGVRIEFIRHCSPVLLERPQPVLITTVARSIAVVFKKRSDALFVSVCAVYALLLRKAYCFAFQSRLDRESSL